MPLAIILYFFSAIFDWKLEIIINNFHNIYRNISRISLNKNREKRYNLKNEYKHIIYNGKSTNLFLF